MRRHRMCHGTYCEFLGGPRGGRLPGIALRVGGTAERSDPVGGEPREIERRMAGWRPAAGPLKKLWQPDAHSGCHSLFPLSYFWDSCLSIEVIPDNRASNAEVEIYMQ